MKQLKFALVIFALGMVMSFVLAVMAKDSPLMMTTAFLMFLLNLQFFFKTISEMERK